MKRIGIVTYYKNYNYGSVLQAYALSRVVESMGYTVEIVDYLDYSKEYNLRIKKNTYIKKVITILQNPNVIIPTLRRKKKSVESLNNSTEKKKAFDTFVGEQLNLSKECYLCDYYDAVICGSDQVWRGDSPGLDELFFLRPFNRNKRIAYAPSIGISEIPNYNYKAFRKYVGEIDFLSVRETTASALIQDITGKYAPVVADPVLLAGREFWNTVIGQPQKHKPYALCYFLDKSEESIAAIEKLQEGSKADILWVDGGVQINKLNFTPVTPSPIEFVNLIKCADIVYTDSYHATLFSIMLHTEFVVFERNYGAQTNQSTRIDSILNITALQDTRYSEGKIECGYDFDSADTALESIRNESMNFLRSAITQATGGENEQCNERS